MTYHNDPRDVTPAEKKARAKLYAEAQALNDRPYTPKKAPKLKKAS